jgi:hypothetical protein
MLSEEEIKNLTYDLVSEIKDPEFDKTYEELNMIKEDDIFIIGFLISA